MTTDCSVAQHLETLRRRLLDLSNRNKFLNFKFSERSRTQIRMVEGGPNSFCVLDDIFDLLEEGKTLTIKPLPNPPDHLLNASDKAFGDRLKKARRQDKKYQKLAEALELESLELEALELEILEAKEQSESQSEQSSSKTRSLKTSASRTPTAENPESESVKTYQLKLANVQRLEQDLQTLDQKLKRVVRAALKKELKAKHVKQLGITLNYDLSGYSASATDHEVRSQARQKHLQTLLYADELERKVSGLRDGARKSLQESGLNTLYLAFGMLEWCESNQSDRRFAPLFLYPIVLEKQKQNDQWVYRIQSSGEGPEENFSLRERLQRDHGVTLPPFQTMAEEGAENEEEDNNGDRNKDGNGDSHDHSRGNEIGDEITAKTPELYFEQVVDSIQHCHRWRVRPSLTLSLFSFGGIVLFQDLNPERWPEDASILNHPLLETMFCGQKQDEWDDHLEAIAPDYPVDDPAIAKKASFLIADADTSQVSAIVDAMDGKNLVIEGPPGTGKSQTITNLIAVALAKGKNVLFVAQKKAALDVVYNRLVNAGLEHYCLDVHSTRESKQSFYDHLKLRVEQECPKTVSRPLKRQQKECEQLKQQLSHYATVLNQPFGNVEQTIQEIFWAAQRANDELVDLAVPSTVSSVWDEQAIAMTDGDFQRKCQHLETFSQRYAVLTQLHRVLNQHPWFGLANPDLSPIDQGDVCAAASEWCKALKDLQASVQEIMDTFDLEHPLTLDYPQTLHQELTTCPELEPSVVITLLPILQKETAQQSVAKFVDLVRNYRNGKQDLLTFFQKNIGSSPLLNLIPAIKEFQQANNDNLESISTALSILKKEVPELCNPSHSDLLNRAKTTCEQLQDLQTDLEKQYRLDACESPERMVDYAASLRQSNLLSFLLNGAYRKAKKLWARIQITSQKRSDAEISDIFMAISQFQNQRDEFLNDSTVQQVCAPHFKDLDTDFKTLISVHTFAKKLLLDYEDIDQQTQQIQSSEFRDILEDFYQDEHTDIERLAATHQFAQAVTISALPPSIQSRLLVVDADQILEDIQITAELLAETIQSEDSERQGFLSRGKPDIPAMFGVEVLNTQTIDAIVTRLERAIAAPDDLPDWISYHQAYQAVEEDGLKPLLDAFEDERLPMSNMVTVYPSIFYRSLLRLAYQEYPELQDFSGTAQAQGRERFQQVDQSLLELHQKQLAAQLGKRPVDPGKNGNRRKSEWTNQALIQNEIAKQRRHISQRSLFQRASVALQQLKPCWMMSPASVAQFVPPGAVTFDMVIIDEASQMRPEEAVGAIARAKQVVVVGDPKQLPPTNFFRARLDVEDEDGMINPEDLLDDESILDMALRVFYPIRRLKWHYRSRHESLIAFSNLHFYDRSLTIFPSPNNQFAVDYHYVEAGSYSSGANRTEAKTVAEATAHFMRQHPHLSLGIVTLNQKQQQLLLDEMDELFAENPDLDAYCAAREDTLEPFFVKNLENVQGDERDVIFISTVYGPERPGEKVNQRFGPITTRNGHRRLNVLFTRAKEKIVVFSSMKPTDIRPSPTSNPGVHILKAYLDYAQSQTVHTAADVGTALISDFEWFVAEKLRQSGYEVVPRVGVSGYFIDLAIVHPKQPKTYLLGLECDGDTYHSSKATRDRDRLRQQVLERLGWTLYRIWTPDWFANPTAELKKLNRYLSTLSEG